MSCGVGEFVYDAEAGVRVNFRCCQRQDAYPHRPRLHTISECVKREVDDLALGLLGRVWEIVSALALRRNTALSERFVVVARLLAHQVRGGE
jgi:hypothetical protein